MVSHILCAKVQLILQICKLFFNFVNIYVEIVRNERIHICVLNECAFSIEGVSIEERKCLKMAKNRQKTHKMIKKFRARLRM